jgi:hypothetical protein
MLPASSLNPIPEHISVGGEIISPQIDPALSLSQWQMADVAVERLQPTSDMDTLRHRYFQDEDNMEDDTESVHQMLVLLTMKTTIELRDLVDRGKNPNYKHYRIEQHLLDKIEKVMYDLQDYLECAVLLIPGCIKFFHLDPGDALLAVLKNAENILHCQVAWDLLREQIILGEHFFDKYHKEYLEGKDAILSPVSMEADITESLLLM